MKYASEGYRYYSVETPSVFAEELLPEDDLDMTAAHQRRYQKLLDLAERYGTHVTTTTYQRG